MVGKTIEEWFNELDEHKELALLSINKRCKDNIENTMSDALAFGFIWSESKNSNGGTLWSDLYLQYKDKGE